MARDWQSEESKITNTKGIEGEEAVQKRCSMLQFFKINS